MNAEIKTCIFVRGSTRPHRLAARIRKHLGVKASVLDGIVVIESSDRDAVDRIIAAE